MLSGYLGSARAREVDPDGRGRGVKAADPAAIYFCDPVMGHPEEVHRRPWVTRFLTEKALPAADVVAPNLLELETLCGPV